MEQAPSRDAGTTRAGSVSAAPSGPPGRSGTPGGGVPRPPFTVPPPRGGSPRGPVVADAPQPTGSGPLYTASAPLAHREIRRHSLREQILQALRGALLDGDLAPGEVYSAPALGLRFGVSATPVREAMQQLASEGAVEVVPNRGFRISVRGPRERAELAEVRALIEAPVVLRLARTLPADRWAGLRPLADAAAVVAATGDRAGYAEADRAFHRAVLSLGGNDQLVAVADDLHRRSQWPPAGTCLIADAAQHIRLLEALTSDDVPAALPLIEAHFGPTP